MQARSAYNDIVDHAVFFKNADRDFINKIVPCICKRLCHPHELVYKRGDRVASIYFVIMGSISDPLLSDPIRKSIRKSSLLSALSATVSWYSRLVSSFACCTGVTMHMTHSRIKLAEGDMFGEVEYVQGLEQYTRTAVCSRQTMLYCLATADLDVLFREFPAEYTRLEETAEERSTAWDMADLTLATHSLETPARLQAMEEAQKQLLIMVQKISDHLGMR